MKKSYCNIGIRLNVNITKSSKIKIKSKSYQYFFLIQVKQNFPFLLYFKKNVTSGWQKVGIFFISGLTFKDKFDEGKINKAT